MDCMDLMREYPDKYFDVAIVDPPYGIGIGTHVGGANHLDRKVTIGGASLSRPKYTGDLTIARSPMRSTLMN